MAGAIQIIINNEEKYFTDTYVTDTAVWRPRWSENLACKTVLQLVHLASNNHFFGPRRWIVIWSWSSKASSFFCAQLQVQMNKYYSWIRICTTLHYFCCQYDRQGLRETDRVSNLLCIQLYSLHSSSCTKVFSEISLHTFSRTTVNWGTPENCHQNSCVYMTLCIAAAETCIVFTVVPLFHLSFTAVPLFNITILTILLLFGF